MTLHDLAARCDSAAAMLENTEDALDSHVARTRIAELQSGAVKLVTGADLDKRLDDWCGEYAQIEGQEA